MTKAALKKFGFKKVDGFLELTAHGVTLCEGDKMGYLDVFDLDNNTKRFKTINGIANYLVEASCNLKAIK